MKRKSWQDYQKEIADDRYYYARSCIRQNFFPGSEKLFIDMLRNDLGKDLSDDPKHSSCTGIGYHSDIVPLETIMTVVARQFALMGEAGYENLVTSCITSFGVYTEILATWHEFPETEEKTRENLWKATRREFKKPASLAHTSDVVFHFREEIAARAKKRLVNAATGEPLKVANCPGCAMFLDKWQYAIAEMEGTTYGQNGHGIPVLTYEEMAGLVLGYDPWELGMQMHQVDVEPLLDKMGVEYDPAAKYLGRNGKYIGKPESAVVNCCPTDTIYDIRE